MAYKANYKAIASPQTFCLVRLKIEVIKSN